MSAILPILRPNTVAIDRRTPGAQSVTGSPSTTITRLNANVPALIDIRSRGGGGNEWTVEGQVYIQDALLFLDGLRASQFATIAPGGTIALNGVTYTVATNGRGAYPDVKRGDRVTDEAGTTYLVLAIAVYYDVMPLIEVFMSRGRAWEGAPS